MNVENHHLIVLNFEEFSIQYIETTNKEKTNKFDFLVLDLATDCEISLLC